MRHLAILTSIWTRRNILMTFKGPATRSIHLLELRFHWSIQVDFMRHVIYVNRQSHVSNCCTGVEYVCHSNEICCCMDQEAEAWIKVSSLWDPTEPHWGREERTHKNTEHTELTHQADCPAVVTMCHMGPPFCWLTRFRFQLTIPPFLYFFYSQGSKSSAAFIFGTNTKLNLHSAEFPWLVLRYRTPNCVIRIKGKCTVPYLSDSKPNGRVP